MNNRPCEKAKKNLRDDKVPGLMLSVGKRSKTFYLYRRVDGKPRRIMLGRSATKSVAVSNKRHHVRLKPARRRECRRYVYPDLAQSVECPFGLETYRVGRSCTGHRAVFLLSRSVGRTVMTSFDPAAVLLVASLLGFLVLVAAIIGVALTTKGRRK